MKSCIIHSISSIAFTFQSAGYTHPSCIELFNTATSCTNKTDSLRTRPHVFASYLSLDDDLELNLGSCSLPTELRLTEQMCGIEYFRPVFIFHRVKPYVGSMVLENQGVSLESASEIAETRIMFQLVVSVGCHK